MTTEQDPQPSRKIPPSSSGGHSEIPVLFAGVDELCKGAVRGALVDGAALAVVTRHAHTRELAYATDAIAVRLDELQFTLGEGPCLDAYLDDEPQFHPDLDSARHTSRWPTFASEATALGVHSFFAFPVPGARRPTGPCGVVEFYRRTASSLTTEEHAAALAAARAIGDQLQTNWEEHRARFVSTDEAIDAAARAIGDQLQTNWEEHRARFVSTDEAIDAAAAAAIAVPDGTAEPFTRTQVHVAAGMLAVQLNVAPDEALDRLRAHSYASGRRISAVAAEIIAHRLTVHDE